MSAKSLDKLFSVDIRGLCSKKSDVLSHLNKLHKSLRNLKQEEAEAHNKVLKTATAPQLISPALLRHTDKDVKTLSTCCIVDILRLLAPENPYNNEDTITAFKAVVNQLGSLSTVPVAEILDSSVYYIFDSIATVQSCVVPVLLAAENVFEAEDVAVAMFNSILGNLRADHPQEVLAHAVAILQACFVESEGKIEDLLDQLLMCLLPQNKVDNTAAYQVAATVLRNTTDTLEKPLTALLNSILVGASRESIGCSAEIADNVYSLIYELHRIDPRLLNPIIPSICLQLQAEEEDVRFRAVRLLGQLFASPNASYGVDFGKCFREYVARGTDMALKVRLEVVESCGLIVQYMPALRKAVEAPLVLRLRDPDERLRLAALSRLIDLAHLAPTGLAAETYTEMAEKVKDRKAEVRRLAMVGLARLYNHHVSGRLPPLSTLARDGIASVRDCVDSDVLRLLSFVPGHLLLCWGYQEVATRHLVVHLLQEVLLPKAGVDIGEDTTTTSSPPTDNEVEEQQKPAKRIAADAALDAEDRRATALLLMYEHLSSAERNALAAALGFKARVRAELQALLKIRATAVKNGRLSDAASVRSSSSGDSNGEMNAEEHARALRKCMLKLHTTLPPADKKTMHFEAICAKKDRTVFRLLEQCISPADSVQHAVQRREDLKQRLVSKSPLGEYIGTVFDFASGMTASTGMVQQLLGHLEGQGISTAATSCADLLALLAKYCPQAFEDSADALCGWLDTCVTFDGPRTKRELRNQLLAQCVSVIGGCCPAFEQGNQQHGLCAEVVEHVKKCLEPEVCEKLAELAGQMAYYSSYDASTSATSQHAVRTVKNLLTLLTSSKHLTVHNKRLDCDLAALAALCVVPRAAYIAMDFAKPSFTAVVEVICAKATTIATFVQESLLQAGGEGSTSARTLALGLRAMTNALAAQAEMAQIRPATAVASNASEVSGGGSASRLSKELQDLVTLLFDCIKSSGAELAAFSTEEEAEKELLFEAASNCAMSLTKLHAFARTVTVEQWHTLGWTLLCPVPAIRERLFSTLNQLSQVHPLHAKFLAYPCLFATDEALYARAEQALAFAVQRRRRTHEQQCALAMGRDQPDNQARLNGLMPESILPYLLHLLSYHPDFPTSTTIESEADKRRMKNLVRSVSMLLQVLQHSLINESSNMSYLLKLLNTANRFYVDRTHSENVGLHFVIRLTVKLLHEQIKTSDNLQNHPGEVTLPAELYKRKVGEAELAAGEDSAATQLLGGLYEAEQAIDKALQIAGKGNKPHKTTAAGRATAPAAKHARGGDGEEGGGGRKRAAESPADDGRRKSGDRSRTSYGSAEKPTNAAARLPEEAPTRMLPKRGAKEVVSYREPVESEREMLQWEEAAARAKKPRRSSELSASRSSVGSVGGATSGDGEKGRSSLSAWLAKSQEDRVSGAGMRPSMSPTTMRSPRASQAEASGASAGRVGDSTQASFDPLLDVSLTDLSAPAPAAAKKAVGAKRATAQPVTAAVPAQTQGKGADKLAEKVVDTGKARALQPRTNVSTIATVPEEQGKGKTTAGKPSAVTGNKKGSKVQPVEEPEVTAKAAVAPTKGKSGKAAVAVVAEEPVAPPVRRSTRPMRG